MITLITGAPGAGKTAALVSMLADLGKDRAIYAHGIPDLKIPHVVLDDPAAWPDTVPDGAVVIIDEVQTVWRPSGPGQKIPDSIQKLETHRHRGLDFYIITQGPNLVHSNVRALVGRHVHLRDIGVFGRWWYEWPETADNCRTGWKNAPVKKRYRLPKHIFGQYKSASLHVKPERSLPPVVFVFLAALLGLGYLGWKAYGSISAKVQGTPPALAQSTPSAPAAPASIPKPGAPAGFDPITGTIADPLPPGVLDDRVAFIPRVPDKPETAPAYDSLRQVVNMPLVTGAACFKGHCKCFTQQGTNAGLSHEQCKAWMDQPPFDPYTVRINPAPAPSGTDAARNASPPLQTVAAPAATVSEAPPLNVGGAINPRLEARPPPVLPPGSPFHPTLPTGSAGTLPPPTLLNPHRQT